MDKIRAQMVGLTTKRQCDEFLPFVKNLSEKFVEALREAPSFGWLRDDMLKFLKTDMQPRHLFYLFRTVVDSKDEDVQRLKLLLEFRIQSACLSD